MAQNYESKYWGLFYDQMMEEHLGDWLEENRAFYASHLHDVKGQVLDCACGTGLILLPLLTDGFDVKGFDISDAMLSTLRSKALDQGFSDIDERISKQNLETFTYPMQFDAAIIPTNSFVLLATQDAQISCLRNVYSHLVPGGRLLMDIRLDGMKGFVECPDGIMTGRWGVWDHPETGKPIRQRLDQVGCDLTNQLTFDRCYVEYEGYAEEFPMTARWIFKDEFQLLLRLAGFRRWDVWGGRDHEPLFVTLDDTNSYWIAYKD